MVRRFWRRGIFCLYPRNLNWQRRSFSRYAPVYGLEYHVSMRPVIPPSVATVAVLAIFLFVPAGQAQVNGPSSLTFPGFGGRPLSGTPPGVALLGLRGASGPQIPLASAANGLHHGNGHPHRQHDGALVGPLWYAFPVPYAVPVPYAPDNSAVDDDSDGTDNDPDDQGGPTVFDRRGSGASSYVPPVSEASPAAEADPDDPPADPAPPQVPTVLVFKDGRNVEVGNYAIVGTTLFDLTPGHPRRIALADLDLDATRKQNDDRGVVFQIPQSLQAN
jgi:hypothetical protein